MISVAIPYHGDRYEWTMQSIRNVHDHDKVKEIVIVIDKSDVSSPNLITSIREFCKVSYISNDKRLLAFNNKIKTVRLCKQPWVALIDSDNVINCEYIDKFLNETKYNNVIYQPCKGKPALNYESYIGKVIDLKWAKEHIDDLYFDRLINTGNYIFFKSTWIESIDKIVDKTYDPFVDVAYANYYCLKNGMCIKVIEGMEYMHTVHSMSTYVLNSKKSTEEYKIIRSWYQNA